MGFKNPVAEFHRVAQYDSGYAVEKIVAVPSEFAYWNEHAKNLVAYGDMDDIFTGHELAAIITRLIEDKSNDTVV